MSVRLVRLVRVFAVLAVAGLLAAAAGLTWIAYALHDFSGDIASSQRRLPPRVPTLLPEGGNMLDEPQVTLVRYTGGVSRGAAVLLFTLPDSRRVSLVTLPPSAQIGGEPLERLGVPGLVRSLDRLGGIAVSHVALIDPAAVGPLIGRMGGVNVTNPQAFTTQVDGRSVVFPQGRLALEGRRAAAFAQAATTREPLELASASLLAGIVHRLLQPTSVQNMRELGGELASAVSTDLSDADVLGLVELRLRGGTALQCLAPRRLPITAPPTLGMLERAGGARPPVAGDGCRERSVPATTVTPPVVVVRLAQRYGWQGFAAGATAALLLAITLSLLLAWRWPRAGRPASIWPPLPGPGVRDDVVWSGHPTAPQPPPDQGSPPEPKPEPEPEQPTRAREG